MGPQEPQAPQVSPTPEQPAPQPQFQPQPAQQPQMVAPQQPVVPAASQQPFGPQQFGSNPAMMPQAPKKSKKGLVIGLVAGGVGLLLLIAGIIVAVLLLGPPSKADFQKAYDKANSMVTKYNDFTGSSEFSDLSSDKAKEKFNQLKAEYDKDNSELAGMKALNDADAKKAFNAYKQKYDSAMPIAEALLTSAASCSNSGSSLSDIYDAKTKQAALDAFDKTMGDCMAALKDMSTSSNADVAAYAKPTYEYMNNLRTYYGDMIGAYAANDYTAASKLKAPSPPDTDQLSLSNDKYNFAKAFDAFVTVLRDKKS